MLAGVEAYNMLRNNTFVEGKVHAEQATRLTEQAAKQSELANKNAVQAAREDLAAIGTALSKGSSRATVRDLGTVMSKDVAASDAKAWSEIASDARAVQRRYNLAETQAASLVASAKAGVDFELASNILSSKASASAGAGVQLSADQRQALQRDYSAIQSATTSQQAQATKDLVTRLATSEKYQAAVISNQEDRNQVAARFDRAAHFSAVAEAAYSLRDTLNSQAEAARATAISLGYRKFDDPAHSAEMRAAVDASRRDPSDVARAIRYEGNLAREALSRPNRYTNGDAVVNPRAAYDQLKNTDLTLKNTTAQIDANNRDKIGPMNTSSVGASPEISGTQTTIDQISNDVENRGARVKRTAAERDRDVTDALALRYGEDGKFGTDNSLIGEVVSNTGRDVADTTKQRVLDLFRSRK